MLCESHLTNGVRAPVWYLHHSLKWFSFHVHDLLKIASHEQCKATIWRNNKLFHVKNLPQTTNHLKVQYLQIDKWSKKHKDKKPLSRSILVEQKDYGCQLKYEQQIQLKCNLKSPNINLPLICRLLRWLLLLSTLCLITGSPSLRSRPTAEQIIWKTAIFNYQFI